MIRQAQRILFVLAVIVSAMAFLSACGDDSESSSGQAQADDDDDDDNDNDDDDNDNDNNDNDDSSDDDDDDSIFHHPHDGRLYVAAGSAVITPNDENHPCLQTLAGTALNRLATGVHDELELRVIVMEKDGVHFVLIVGDLIGLRLPDAQLVMKALAAYGVDPEHVIFSSTHSHEAPDTVGIWGKNVFRTGRCPEYINFLIATATAKVVELAAQMVPVTVEAATVYLDDPQAPDPAWVADSRWPLIKNRNLTAARFLDEAGKTVATLVNWHCHPEVLIWSSEYSADFPRWLRNRMEDEFGGIAVYISGTVGGLLNPFDIGVPEYTADGEPVLENGQPVYIGDGSEANMWSMGYALADRAIAALADATPLDLALTVDTTAVKIPVTNLVIVLAIVTGLVPPFNGLVTDEPGFCGFYGCFVQTLQHVRLGRLHLVAVPGEGLSESSIGRVETAYDFGAPWGVAVFPAMSGYREALPEGDLLIDIGLANNEIGYILPETDLHPASHPDYYEEKYNISRPAERIIREALTEMLDGSQ
ncbi:MAG: hypothetical protein GX444_09760 [Myxococcales bacterium]|nr:hypothetical protein [Myxococcales bacterium]